MDEREVDLLTIKEGLIQLEVYSCENCAEQEAMEAYEHGYDDGKLDEREANS
jgi:hypothetical protein